VSGQVWFYRPADDFQAIPQAGEQSVEHVVAEVSPPGQVLIDAGLPHPADSSQLGLGGAGFQHHLPQDLAASGHDTTIARTAIGLREADLLRHGNPGSAGLFHRLRSSTRRIWGNEGRRSSHD
jgi:hypothetical protein